MAALNNTITTEDVVTALDVEMSMNFDQEVNRLLEVLGIFGTEVVPAGTSLYQYKITGSLDASSVAEGDEVPLSKYTIEKDPITELTVKPYRKLTTAQAILKSGFENAIRKTDNKMVKDIRGGILADFFTFLGNGAGTATGAGLQAALAKADAALGDALEENNDSSERYVHFVNRQDIADYLATAAVTTQTVFGMEYLQNFLGVTDIFITSKVAAGTIFVTPVENIHIYGVDFAALGSAALTYEQQENSLIGVHHEPNYSRTSAETYVLTGASFIPEATNYIIKGTVSAIAKTSLDGGVAVATSSKK